MVSYSASGNSGLSVGSSASASTAETIYTSTAIRNDITPSKNESLETESATIWGNQAIADRSGIISSDWTCGCRSTAASASPFTSISGISR
jgi:hypothetical protein